MSIGQRKTQVVLRVSKRLGSDPFPATTQSFPPPRLRLSALQVAHMRHARSAASTLECPPPRLGGMAGGAQSLTLLQLGKLIHEAHVKQGLADGPAHQERVAVLLNKPAKLCEVSVPHCAPEALAFGLPINGRIASVLAAPGLKLVPVPLPDASQVSAPAPDSNGSSGHSSGLPAPAQPASRPQVRAFRRVRRPPDGWLCQVESDERGVLPGQFEAHAQREMSDTPLPRTLRVGLGALRHPKQRLLDASKSIELQLALSASEPLRRLRRAGAEPGWHHPAIRCAKLVRIAPTAPCWVVAQCCGDVRECDRASFVLL